MRARFPAAPLFMVEPLCCRCHRGVALQRDAAPSRAISCTEQTGFGCCPPFRGCVSRFPRALLLCSATHNTARFVCCS